MKNLYLAIVLAVLSVVCLNVVFFMKFKRNIIDYQKALVAEQVGLCGSHIEKTIASYENDLTRIIFANIQKMPDIFTNDRVFKDISLNLQGLYSKNRDLISNISVYDNKDSYLGIYLKDNDELVIDSFPRQSNNELRSKDIIIKQKGYYLSYFPFYKNNELNGNIVVEINLERYLNSIFSLFRLKGLQWQWVVSSDNQVMLCNFPDTVLIKDMETITASIDSEEEMVLEHYYSDSEDSDQLIISAVYPLNVLNNDLGVVFTIEAGKLNTVFFRENFILISLSLLVMIVIVMFLVHKMNNERMKQDKRSSDLLSLKMIVEHFPVGIMIIDPLGTIKNINRTGQKMLFLEKDDDITGSKLASQFMVSNKYLLKDGINAPFDSSHFIHYEKDGNEIVIYRKDIKAQIAGEELTISALIDVSALEKSRKQEAAANSAKSDFLAKMSNEIRTPMNGIIDMTELLSADSLTEKQKEQVQFIRRSSDLLLNIINDVLDFSKIEGGKMMLEEIPFNLAEEIGFCISLFKNSADEKGLEIQTNIDSDIPDRLVGDPLRLRQVISNLISNAIKFTEEGKITIGVVLAERHNLALSLLFSVEDTGIGVSKGDSKKIFGNFAQAKSSESRRDKGTGLGMVISKQLVELMNGQIWVESPVSDSKNTRFPGAKFSFTVEVHSNEPLKKKFDFTYIKQYLQVSALILTQVKDDHDTIHRLLDRFGINYDFRVYDENTIDSAIFHVEQKRNLYQMIIVMDKPGYDGFTMAHHLKESKLYEHFPVIMISSNDQPGNYVRSRSLGIDHYLIQPFESNEVYRIVKEYFPGLKDNGGVAKQVVKIRSRIAILFADDNIINQRLTQSAFKHLGFEIDIAKNGAEAVEMATSKHYDLVFMDIFMPEMDGITAASILREKGLKMPIIAITGADEAEKKEEAKAAGMNDFILKPIRLESIKELLIRWFSEKI